MQRFFSFFGDVVLIQYFRIPWEIILYKFEGYLVCIGRTHEAPYRGYGYVPLRFGGNVVRRMGTQQHPVCLYFPNYLIFDFFSFKINFLLVVYLKI